VNDDTRTTGSQLSRPFARSNVLGCPVDQMTIPQCLDYFESVIAAGRSCHIVVINAAKVVKARSDRLLAEIIQSADLVGADGVPVVWASRLLGDPLPARVNGTDLMEALFEMAARKSYSVFLLGARPQVIENAVNRLRRQYPNLRIAGYRHGYFTSEDEEQQAAAMISASRPDILMLGMSTPMKEIWVSRHKELLNVPVIHGVGGSFDIVGGITKRAPKWMQNSGLEWLYRLYQEPRRMWRRYLLTNSVFVWLVFRACISRWLKKKIA
jgi:N-acetylglucosaminyldiphosphoundecaprenol N-acetyl-beta-D-mannosaminyltransferase